MLSQLYLINSLKKDEMQITKSGYLFVDTTNEIIDSLLLIRAVRSLNISQYIKTNLKYYHFPNNVENVEDELLDKLGKLYT